MPSLVGGARALAVGMRCCPTCHSTKTLANRIRRRAEAREKLSELQKDMPKEPPEKRHVFKRTEDLILEDNTNPFRMYAYMRSV